MTRFLDPRSDIVFKRIFGEHPEILRDFLNGVLPFEDESQVGLSDSLRQALQISEECGFTPAQLERYDAFWDAVSRERTLLSGRFAEGKAEGHAEGKAEGKAETLLETAAAMKAAGIAPDAIARITGLAVARIAEL
jgi:predicted transposase YdaD